MALVLHACVASNPKVQSALNFLISTIVIYFRRSEIFELNLLSATCGSSTVKVSGYDIGFTSQWLGM
jgi:hypothetical protein